MSLKRNRLCKVAFALLLLALFASQLLPLTFLPNALSFASQSKMNVNKSYESDLATSGHYIDLLSDINPIPPTRWSGLEAYDSLRAYLPIKVYSDSCCLFTSQTNFSVITTIASKPTKTMIGLVDLNWCVISIGDKKSPSYDEFMSGSLHLAHHLIYLPVEIQLLLPYQIIPLTPLGSFARKNIGFLVAVHSGAQIIFDVDDDNIFDVESVSNTSLPVRTQASAYRSVRRNLVPLHSPNTKAHVDHSHLDYSIFQAGSMVIQHRREHWYDSIVFNPYPRFTHLSQQIYSHSWPRGFPLSAIRDSLLTVRQSHNETTHQTCTPIVQQYLANHDPDVDAIYRLSSPNGVPFDFMSSQQARDSSDELDFVVPMHVFTPYNAQATIHLYDAFWSLLLLQSVHGRVTDIWRSYIMQWVMRELMLVRGQRHSHPCLMFTVPHVYHDRNAHNYMQDFNAELPLYQQTASLLNNIMSEPISRLADSTALDQGVAGLMTHAYLRLYQRGVIKKVDVDYVSAWNMDLRAIAYQQPKVTRKQSHTAICINFNNKPHPGALNKLLSFQTMFHEYITIITPSPVDELDLALPSSIHHIHWQPHMDPDIPLAQQTTRIGLHGVLQYECASACMSYYSEKHDSLRGVFFQSEDLFVNYSHVFSNPDKYDPDRAWSRWLEAGHLLNLSNGGWNNDPIGNSFSLQYTAQQFQMHSEEYKKAWLLAFGGLDKVTDKAISDWYYIPRKQLTSFVETANFVTHLPSKIVDVMSSSNEAKPMQHTMHVFAGLHFSEMISNAIIRLSSALMRIRRLHTGADVNINSEIAFLVGQKSDEIRDFLFHRRKWEFEGQQQLVFLVRFELYKPQHYEIFADAFNHMLTLSH